MSNNGNGTIKRSPIILFLPAAILMFNLMIARYGITNVLPGVMTSLKGMQIYSIAVIINLLGMCVTTPIGGKLSDIYGRKKIVLLALIIYIVSVVLCAFSSTVVMFIASYLLMGIAYGLIIGLPNSMVADVIEPHDRPRYLGYLVTAQGSAMIIGPILGGIVADKLGPQTLFWVVVPLQIISFLTILALYPNVNNVKQEVKIDFLGMLFIAIFSISLVIQFNFAGSKWPWVSTTTLCLFAVTIVSLIILFKIEARAKMPIINPKLFKIRDFKVVCAMQLFSIPYLICNGPFLAMFGQKAMKLSATTTGSFSLLMIFSPIMGLFVGSYLIKNVNNYRRALVFSGVIFTVTLFVLSTLNVNSSIIMIYAGIALTNGVAGGICQSTMPAYMLRSLPKEEIGAGMSMIPFCNYLGSTIAAAICGGMLNAQKGNIAVAMGKMYLLAAVSCVIFTAIAFAYVSREKKVETQANLNN